MFNFFKTKNKKSGSIASNRLRVVITQDRASISQEVMNDLKRDMIYVFQKYLVIEESGLECVVQREREKNIGLSITIPVKKVKNRRGTMFDED